MIDAAPTIRLPGIPDIVTSNAYDGTVSVLIGNGDGTFQTPVTRPVGIGPAMVAVGDINGDGFPDIVTANFAFFDQATQTEVYGNNDVSVLLGNGSGGFTAASGSPVSLGANAKPFAVAVADMNGDGFGDIVVGNYGTSTVTVLKSNGNGTFTAETPVALPTGAGPSYVVTGDFNRDGKTDVITSNFGTGTITVLIGDGTGGLTQKQTIAVGAGPETIALSDINGDGITDLVVTNYNATNVSVLLGNGDGTFRAAPTPTVNLGGAAFGVALGDINGDGKADMVVADFGNSTVSVFLGDGSGGFTADGSPIAVGSLASFAAYSVSLADVNGDGKLDMVLSARSLTTGHGEVVVMLGNGNGTFQNPASAAVYQVGGNADYAVVASLEPLTVNENASLVFSGAHGNAITVGDVDGGSSSETVTLSVTHGTLTLGSTAGLTGLTGNGGASLSFSGTIAQLNAAMNGLTYTPTAHYHGADAVKVSINDNTGVQPATSSAQELSVLAVNNAPAGTDNTIATLEDTGHTFAASDFGFTDPNDSPANNLLAVEITTLPTAGTLKDNGVAVTAGQFVSVTDINAGHLVFTPAGNVNGNGYAHFTFQVEDDGGTANGGVNLDQSPNTITLNVTPVNDAPVASGTTALALPNTVSALFSGNFDDSADNQPALPGGSTANTLAGIAITGDTANATTQGSWEYSTDGGTSWIAIVAGSVSANSALVLSSTAELRFVAAAGFSGAPGGLTAHVIDNSTGNVSTTGVTGAALQGSSSSFTGIDIASHDGGSTPISTGTASLTATVPGVTSIHLAGSSPNNSGSDVFTVTFSESVTGVDASDFALTTTNTPGGIALSTSGISSISGSGATYTVTVRGVTGDGTLRLDLNSGDSNIIDSAGTAVSAGFTAGDVYTVDNIPPTVSSINAAAASPNHASSEVFTVTFSEGVTGVDNTDFTAVTSGAAADTGITVTPVNASVYTVTVNGVTGDGTLGLNLNSSGTGITDTSGNTLAGGFTGQVYTVDHIAPTVSSITALGGSPNDAASEQYQVTFSEVVTGVVAADFQLTTTNTVNTGGITSITGSGATYTVTIGAVTGDGTLRLDLKSGDGGITDAAGNGAAAAFTSGDVYTIDHTPPGAVSINLAGTSPTDGSSEAFTVTFSENVIGVDSSDFTVLLGGTAFTGITVLPVSGSVYTVTVNGVTGNGTLQLDLDNAGTGITDLAGNAIVGGLSGQAYTVDQTAPTVTVSATSTTLLAGQTSTVTFTFSEAIQNFVLGDTSVTGGALSDLAHTGLVAGRDIYTATFTPNPSDPEVGSVQVNASSYSDVAGNAGAASNNLSFNGDTLVPTVTVSANSTTLLAGQTSTVTFTFSEAIQNFVLGDTSFTGGALTNLVHTGLVAGEDIYTATFTPDVTNTEVGSVQVNASSYSDLAGNAGAASNNLGFSGDTVAPTVSVAADHTALLAGLTALVTFTFSEALSAFTFADTTVTGGALSDLTHTGLVAGQDIYTAVFTPDATNTEVGSVQVTASSYTDVAGNAGSASNTVDFSGDTLAPTATSVTATTDNGHTDINATHVVTITLHTSESVVVTGTPELQLNDTEVASYTGGTANALNFSYTVQPHDNSPDLHVQSLLLNGGSVDDAAGNPLAPVAADLGIQIDTTAPTLTGITALPGSGTAPAGSMVEFVFSFDEAVNVSGGTPMLSLDDGASAVYDPPATAALHDPTKLAFDYLVSSSDPIKPSLAVTGFVAKGATVADVAGNAATLNNVAATFPLQVNETVIPALPLGGGITRPALISDPTGHIVLDPTSAAFAETYGIKALYAGLPASTPYPPVDPQHDFHLSL
jgi:hypothetical protein